MSTRFFTNQADQTLLRKFRGVFESNPDIEWFDALVGYLRASGYFAIRPFLANVPHIRILVGINVDAIMADYQRRGLLFMPDPTKALEEFKNDLRKDIQRAAYSKETENGILQFVEDVASKKISIRAHPTQRLHAKLCIFRPKGFNEHKPGAVITGSSNLTAAGLGTTEEVRNYEFNVLLHDYTDVCFAAEEFERLWDESTEILPKSLQQVRDSTYLAGDVSPHELFWKLLIEYFGPIPAAQPADRRHLENLVGSIPRQQAAEGPAEVQRRPPRPQPDPYLRTPLGLQHVRQELERQLGRYDCHFGIVVRPRRLDHLQGAWLQDGVIGGDLFGQLPVTPPLRPQFPDLAPQGLVITNTAGVVALKLTCPGNPGENTIVRGSKPVSQGVEVCKDFRILGTCPVPAAGAADITSLYTARYGAPKVATKVYVQVNQFVDGWESLPRTYSAIVPPGVRAVEQWPAPGVQAGGCPFGPPARSGPGQVHLGITTMQRAEIRNPKSETRNKFKCPMAQCSKLARALWFWSFPSSCLGFVSGFGFRISDFGPRWVVAVSRRARPGSGLVSTN